MIRSHVGTATTEGGERVGFVSLGCPTALVDSERILTQPRIESYEITPYYEHAGEVIVNTCGFIDAAKEESLDAIGEATSENGRVLVTGCMGHCEDAETIRARHPRVLGIRGPAAYEEVLGTVREMLLRRHQPDPLIDLTPAQGVKLTPRHYAYLKISEGCNHRCRFCIIPSIRWDPVSRPSGSVMDEAEGLVRAGVRELLVVSQYTSACGVDLKYKTDFWQGRPLKSNLESLASALSELGIWVRLHCVYPDPRVDTLIPIMAAGKPLPYIDMPLQHGAQSVLQRMKRPAATEKTLDRIARWRDLCPDLSIRSTFIVGYPGENEAEFETLLQFIETAQLDRVGCFHCSAVKGAAANHLPDPVPEEIKANRWEQFMALQQSISASKLQRKVGTTQQILIDTVSAEGSTGRTRADAPEIDGVAHLPGVTTFQPGELVGAEITSADEYDLWVS